MRSRILIGIASVLGLAIVSAAIAISRDAPCPAPGGVIADAPRMNAVVQRCYGPPEVLEIAEVGKPLPADHEVLVRVHAAALNPLDYHYLRGKPYVMRLSLGLGAPDDPRFGVDFAGTVEAVGASVTRFKPGDEVFGGRSGAFAEYVVVREERAIAHKPQNLTFEQAATLPIAAITALQALRDTARIEAGDKVLINGASGGVGTFAVQIAKSYGAEVTGVCSTRNVELVRSLGADRVIDYTQEDFTRDAARYDVVIDNVGNRSLGAVRRVMQPDGVLVMVGGPKRDPWIGPMMRPIKAAVLSPFVSEEMTMLLADLTREDLDVLGELSRSGKLTPVIDRRYALSEIREAIGYLETGRARGKVVVNLL